MKTIWLLHHETDHTNVRVYEFSALKKQIAEFNEVGFFDKLLTGERVDFMFTSDHITLEEYGYDYEYDLLEVIGCLDSYAEFKENPDNFTLNGLKYFQAITDFINRYDGIENNKKFFLVIG